MQHHPEARFKTAEELVAHYKGVYRRIDSAGQRQERKERAVREARLAEARAALEVARRSKEERLRRLATLIPSSQAGTARSIIRMVAEMHGITPEDIIGAGKTNKVIAARWEAIVRVRSACPTMSLSSIGRIFRKDHTTIMHALREVEAVAAQARP